ncbi:NAD(P)-binding protein, partial [Aureobasidium melanogenum]
MAQAEIVLITGANTGIGYQIVRALASSNKAYDIIVAGRSLDGVQAAIDTAKDELQSTQSKLHPLQVDIESDESINAAFKTVQSQFDRVDVLINNAGTVRGSFDHLAANGKMSQRENWLKAWNVNTVGTQIMTHTFVPLLLQSTNPRLVFLTSGTSTLGGPEHATVDKPADKGWPKQDLSVAAYRSSKTGMNMMMREWHRLLQTDGVKVWCISPGFLATNIGGAGPEILKKMGAGDPEVVGPFILSVLQGARDADVGKVITKDGIQTW